MHYFLTLAILLISFTTYSQKFSVEPYIGNGNYVSRDHAQGRLYVGAEIMYNLKQNWQIGVDALFGGNFVPGGLLTETQTELIINSGALRFQFIGIGAQYNLKKEDGKAYPYAQSSIGWVFSNAKNIRLKDNASIEQSNLAYTVEAGYVFKQFKVGLELFDFGRIESYSGLADDNRPAVMSSRRNLLFAFKAAYIIPVH